MAQPGWKRIAGGAGILFVALVAAGLVVSVLRPILFFPKRTGLQAVFLSNGQVYFGKIVKEDDARIFLTNIYYIQLKNASVPSSTSDLSDVSLLKLGNEFHGPEDAMEVNRAQVLFVEQLRADGKVAKAIEAYRQK